MKRKTFLGHVVGMIVLAHAFIALSSSPDDSHEQQTKQVLAFNKSEQEDKTITDHVYSFSDDSKTQLLIENEGDDKHSQKQKSSTKQSFWQRHPYITTAGVSLAAIGGYFLWALSGKDGQAKDEDKRFYHTPRPSSSASSFLKGNNYKTSAFKGNFCTCKNYYRDQKCTFCRSRSSIIDYFISGWWPPVIINETRYVMPVEHNRQPIAHQLTEQSQQTFWQRHPYIKLACIGLVVGGTSFLFLRLIENNRLHRLDEKCKDFYEKMSKDPDGPIGPDRFLSIHNLLKSIGYPISGAALNDVFDYYEEMRAKSGSFVDTTDSRREFFDNYLKEPLYNEIKDYERAKGSHQLSSSVRADYYNI